MNPLLINVIAAVTYAVVTAILDSRCKREYDD